MKVTFLNPLKTNSKYKFLGVIAPPLGIGYMAAVLEENNIEVDILDASALNMNYSQIIDEMKKRKSDIVAITALTPTIGVSLDSADAVRKALPNAKIVLGGYHPTFNYEEVLEEENIDIIVRGEGEYTMLELVQTLENKEDLSKVKGLAYKDENNNLIVTKDRQIIEDLDELPFPAYHLLPIDKYNLLNMSTNIATIITTRGCPIQCSFCSSAALHGEKLRRRSVKNVVDEIEHLLNNFEHIDTIAFMDDTFTLNKNYVKEFCEEIKRRNLKFWWGCTSRVDNIDENLLKIMKESGCMALYFGVESADQQMLDKMNKNITIEKTINAFKLSRKIGIRTIASCVLGMPEDTKKNMKKTINFVKKLKPSYAVFSLATPYPGTRFYKESFEKNRIKIKDWSKFTLIEPIMESVDCSKKDLRKIQTKAFIGFYLRPTYLLKQAHEDGIILIKIILGVIKQALNKKSGENTNYNKTNKYGTK